MTHLFRFSPAETLVIKSGEKAPLRDLLKYTLMDLLLKQVLIIEEVQRQPNPRDPIRTYKYITTGKNFITYPFKSHETVFTSIFQENVEIKLLFRNLVKVAYQRAKSERFYYPLLINNENLKVVFIRTFINKLFGGFSYSSDGTMVKKELESEIADLESNLPEIIKHDKNRGLEILKKIGGNIFLLKGIDFALSKEIDKELFEEMSSQGASGGCSSGCWTSFGDYSATFDRSCSSDTSSGCGGDSGCSGCGGCGGD